MVPRWQIAQRGTKIFAWIQAYVGDGVAVPVGGGAVTGGNGAEPPLDIMAPPLIQS